MQQRFPVIVMLHAFTQRVANKADMIAWFQRQRFGSRSDWYDELRQAKGRRGQKNET